MREILLIVILSGVVYAAWSLWQEKQGGSATPKYPKQLYRKVLLQAKNDHALVERLLNHERRKNPGQSETWYLDKVLYNLVRDQ